MTKHFQLQVEITIRRCAERDLPKLEWFGLYRPHREIIREAFQQQRRGDNLMLLADLNGFPVAQVWIDLERFRSDRIGLLWALRVMEPLQRLGIGKRLVRAAERYLATHDYEHCQIGAEKGSSAAVLYERLGYRRIGARDEHYRYTDPDGQHVQVPVDQWIFQKRLHQHSMRLEL